MANKRPKRYKKRNGRIQFDTIPECSKAKCTFCERGITQEETDITYLSKHACVRAYGAIWCNQCQTIYKFDRRMEEVEVR